MMLIIRRHYRGEGLVIFHGARMVVLFLFIFLVMYVVYACLSMVFGSFSSAALW